MTDRISVARSEPESDVSMETQRQRRTVAVRYALGTVGWKT
jgi:hypothetical protein